MATKIYRVYSKQQDDVIVIVNSKNDVIATNTAVSWGMRSIIGLYDTIEVDVFVSLTEFKKNHKEIYKKVKGVWEE